MKRRRLDPEDEALWSAVAATARPLHPARKPLPEDGGTPPVKHAPLKPQRPIAPFRAAEAARARPAQHDIAPSPAERLASQPVRMDRRAHRAITRGRVAPEARLDLHGMTLDQAHGALRRFVLSAQARGNRLILVITGKGRRDADHGPLPVRPGALRHQVPHWLALPPLSQAVLQIASAHAKHGGEGAYYVYLRRPN